MDIELAKKIITTAPRDGAKNTNCHQLQKK
jgi:hypothetical protein